MKERKCPQRWVFDGFMSWLNDVNSWPDNECASWRLPTPQSVKVVFPVSCRIRWVCRLASIVGHVDTLGVIQTCTLRWTRCISVNGIEEMVETVFLHYKTKAGHHIWDMWVHSGKCQLSACVFISIFDQTTNCMNLSLGYITLCSFLRVYLLYQV